MRSIYKLTERGWEHVPNAYNGCQDGSLELACYILIREHPEVEYRVLDERQAERMNKREAA